MREQGRSIQKSSVIVAILLALLSPTPFDSQPAAGDQNGVGPKSPTLTLVDAGEVKARITLSDACAISGQRVGVIINFDIAPGWHIYGKPLPEEYTPTAVTFDKDLLSGQNLDFPKPTPVKFELLGETLPVYQGRFKAVGNILLRDKLIPGEHQLSGILSFQECNDNLCKMPQQVRFGVPLRINSPLPTAPG